MERPKYMEIPPRGGHSPFVRMVQYAHWLEGRISTLQAITAQNKLHIETLRADKRQLNGECERISSLYRQQNNQFALLDALEKAQCTGEILEINYIDVHGSKTTRNVSVLDVYRTINKEWIAKAYCFLRGAERSFRVKSIQSMQSAAIQTQSLKEALANLQKQHDSMSKRLRELGRFVR